MGYRHIDVAAHYGNEEEVGLGIHRALEAGVCSREDLFVTSKLWNTYHAAEHVELACRKSLNDLGLTYLDLYLIHFPISLKFVPFSKLYPPKWEGTDVGRGLKFSKVPVAETWGAMESLVGLGLVRDIGVSNWNCAGLTDLMATCKINPAILQVEVHPYLQCRRLLQYCKLLGIQVTAFSPLGNGESYSNMGYQGLSSISEPLVLSIADRLGVSPAQVVLRWGLQRGCSVIPKSIHEDRMRQNLEVEGIDLTEEDMDSINSLDKGLRFNDPGYFCPIFYGTPCPIWD